MFLAESTEQEPIQAAGQVRAADGEAAAGAAVAVLAEEGGLLAVAELVEVGNLYQNQDF